MTRTSPKTRVGPRVETREETIAFRVTRIEKILIERAAAEEDCKTISDFLHRVVVSSVLGLPRGAR